MTSESLAQLISEIAKKYDPLIDLEQAAEISHRSQATMYDWSSTGKFDSFRSQQKKPVLLSRDAFVKFVMGPNDEK